MSIPWPKKILQKASLAPYNSTWGSVRRPLYQLTDKWNLEPKIHLCNTSGLRPGSSFDIKTKEHFLISWYITSSNNTQEISAFP